MDKEFYKCVCIVIFILAIIYFANEFIYFNSNFYNDIKVISAYSTDMLVNKNNKLNDDYVPDDLVLIDLDHATSNKYLSEEAYFYFKQLHNDAKKQNLNIIIVSAYRPYSYQEKLYNDYVLEFGLVYADSCSARPGHSEHQTGLSIDVASLNLDYDNFSDTKEFIWMKDNSYKYGFILRYPLGSEHITGFKYEPWHYRYVGIDVATYIYENNLTLEEYKKDN